MSKEIGTLGTIAAFLILGAAMVTIRGALIYQSSPQSITNETLTVYEKYPIYSYETPCGKGYHCTQYTSQKS